MHVMMLLVDLTAQRAEGQTVKRGKIVTIRDVHFVPHSRTNDTDKPKGDADAAPLRMTMWFDGMINHVQRMNTSCKT